MTSTATRGAVSTSLGDEHSLNEVTARAMNTLDIDRESPLGPRRLEGLRWSACGDGGVAFVVRGGGAPMLTRAPRTGATRLGGLAGRRSAPGATDVIDPRSGRRGRRPRSALTMLREHLPVGI